MSSDRGRAAAAEIHGYVARHRLGAQGGEGPEWRALLDDLAAVRPSRYAVLGRPEFVTDRWLERLAREAARLRSVAEPASPHESRAGQLLTSPGPAARTFVRHRGWRELLRRTLEFEPQPPYHVTYLYYDSAGAGVPPHVDEPEFAVNVLLMVSRSAAGEDGSATVLHPAGGDRVRVVLQPGEAVVLEAEGLVHAREPMRPGEQVTVLTIGYVRPGYSPSTA